MSACYGGVVGHDSRFQLCRRRLLRLKILRGDDLFVGQSGVALEIALGSGKQSLILGLFSSGAIKRSLERPWIEFRQNIVRQYDVALSKVDFRHLAVDPWPDRHGLRSGDDADACDDPWHDPFPCGDHGHWRGLGRRRLRRCR